MTHERYGRSCDETVRGGVAGLARPATPRGARRQSSDRNRGIAIPGSQFWDRMKLTLLPDRIGAPNPWRRFLVALTVSVYGDWFTTMGVLLAVYALTHSPSAAALYMLVRIAPRAAGPSLGSRLTSRVDPARVMAGVALGQSALMGAAVIAASVNAVWLLLGAVACAQVLGSLTRPAQTMLIALLGKPSRLAERSGRAAALTASSIVVGPALAAPFAAIGGARLLLIVDAISFLVAAALLASLPAMGPGRTPDRAPASRSSHRMTRTPRWRVLMASSFAGSMIVTAFQASAVSIAADRYGSSAWTTWLYAAAGAGATLAAPLLARSRPPARPTAVYASAAFLEVATVVALAHTNSGWQGLILLAACTVAATVYQLFGTVWFQQAVPASQVSRHAAALATAGYGGVICASMATLILVPLWGWMNSLTAVGAAAALVIVAGCAIGASGRWVASAHADEIDLEGRDVEPIATPLAVV